MPLSSLGWKGHYINVHIINITSTNVIAHFVQVSRPDNKPEMLGLTLLDEPCAKQSDPTVLDLQLRALSKQTNLKQVVRYATDHIIHL